MSGWLVRRALSAHGRCYCAGQVAEIIFTYRAVNDAWGRAAASGAGVAEVVDIALSALSIVPVTSIVCPT